MSVSSRVSFFTLSDATPTVQVANGNAITVHQILLASLGGGNNREIIVRTADGLTTTLIDVELDNQNELLVDTPFLADKGIEFVNITSSVELIYVTVWHSNPGM